jgi:hypothetical protein
MLTVHFLDSKWCLRSREGLDYIQSQQLKNTDALAAVAAVGNLKEVRRYIAQGGQVLGRSTIYGNPCAAAASSGNITIIEHLLALIGSGPSSNIVHSGRSVIKSSYPSTLSKKASKMVLHALEAATRLKKMDAMSALLHFLAVRCPKRKLTLNKVYEAAMCTGDVESFNVLLRSKYVKYHGYMQSFPHMYMCMACEMGHEPLLRCQLEAGLIPVS